MTPYIHHRIPEIEKYANQSEWVENTLVDRDSTEVAVENALIDLEMRLDESYFIQGLGESQAQRESQAHNGQQAEERPLVQEESEQLDLVEK